MFRYRMRMVFFVFSSFFFALRKKCVVWLEAETWWTELQHKIFVNFANTQNLLANGFKFKILPKTSEIQSLKIAVLNVRLLASR